MSESEEDVAFESADEDVEGGHDRVRRSKGARSKERKEPKSDKGTGDAAAELEKKLSLDTKAEEIQGNDAKKELEAEDPDRQLSVLEKLAQAAARGEDKSSSTWGFGKWSSSILSTAATSVSSFTNHVSQGIGTVMDTVEATLGAPAPEELAASLEKQKAESGESQETEQKEQPEKEKANPSEEKPDTPSGVSGLLSGVTAFTKAIEVTGSKVLTGGLDTLEMIGKKTMDILTEGDPGLRKKRSMFGGDVSLSEILREAKEKAEQKMYNKEQAAEDNDTVHYSKLFDEHQGLVHLEALEMLCNERKAALQQHALSVGEEDKAEQQAVFDKIKHICESLPAADDTPDDELDQDFQHLVTQHLTEVGLNLRGEKLKTMDSQLRDWLKECSEDQGKGTKRDAKEIYVKSIDSLAEMTAKTMELYHKVAELLLVRAEPGKTPIHYATHLTGLTAVLCTEIGILATRFCHCLNVAADDSEDPDSVTPLITNVYLEASNSNTYIQDGFQLLVPVLQSLVLQIGS